MSNPRADRLSVNFKNSVGTSIVSPTPTPTTNDPHKQLESRLLASEHMVNCLLQVKKMYESRISALEQEIVSLRSPPSSPSPHQSQSICRHYLRGRCRYLHLCRFSHEIIECPYCSCPMNKFTSSQDHLAECSKAHQLQ
jgi:hypothetical protein